MKTKRFISMTMAVLLAITIMPIIPTIAASSISTPIAPEGYTLSYIGRYSQVTPISDDMLAVMYGSTNRGKWGFVNAITRKEIVPPKYSNANSSGNNNVNTEPGVLLRYFDGVARVNIPGKGYLAIDKNGKEIVPLGKYDELSNFHNGIALVENSKGLGIIDKTGREVVSPGTYQFYGERFWENFSEGLIPVSKVDKKLGDPNYNYVVNGYIDTTGKVVIPFGKYSITNRFSEGLACVSVGLYGTKQYKRFFIDKTGKKVFDVKTDGDYLGFSNGLCVFNTYDEKSKTDYYGVIDRTGKEVLKPQKTYKNMFWYKNGYVVATSGPDYLFKDLYKKTDKAFLKSNMLDRNGKLVISTNKLDEVFYNASNGLATKQTKIKITKYIYGFIYQGIRYYDVFNLSTGKSIIPDGYNVQLYGRNLDANDAFLDGYYPDGMVKVYINDGKYDYQGFVNANGVEIVPLGKYVDMGYFSEKKCWMLSQDVARNGYLQKGYIDTNGREIIKPQFDQAGDFINGKALVGIYAGEGTAGDGIDAAPLFDWYVLSAIPNSAVDKYTVKFDTLGGPNVSSLTNIKSRLIMKPDTPVRKGYGFIGWYKDKKCVKEWDFSKDKVTSNTTLYAKWKKI